MAELTEDQVRQIVQDEMSKATVDDDPLPVAEAPGVRFGSAGLPSPVN